jgi:thymidylate synthase
MDGFYALFYKIRIEMNNNIEYQYLKLLKDILKNGVKEQLNREPYPLPTLKIETEVKWVEGDCLPTYSVNDFTIENYQSHPTIKMPLSN